MTLKKQVQIMDGCGGSTQFLVFVFKKQASDNMVCCVTLALTHLTFG